MSQEVSDRPFSVSAFVVFFLSPAKCTDNPAVHQEAVNSGLNTFSAQLEFENLPVIWSGLFPVADGQ